MGSILLVHFPGLCEEHNPTRREGNQMSPDNQEEGTPSLLKSCSMADAAEIF